MHCERYLTIKDGDISDMIVFVNFCTLFFGSNRIVFFPFPCRESQHCSFGRWRGLLLCLVRIIN